MSAKEKLTFESASVRLEEIVKQLEAGNASLDDSLALYEEGIKLVRFCNEAIDNAEKKIKILSANTDGTFTEKDFIDSEE